jgi:lipopolysaccharide exporter
MPLSSFTKPSNSFSGNVLKLVTGGALAQALGILVAPIVTRLFAPEAFGIAALFLSITTIIGVIVCLRYELAIMLPKTDEEATNIVFVSLCSVLLITILSALIFIWESDYILHLIKAPELKNYLWLIPVAVSFAGVSTVLNYWNTRTKHFGRISVVQILASITTQATKLTAGFAGFVSGGVLVATWMLGVLVSAGTLAGQSWRDDKKLFISHVRWRAIADGVIRYKKFPIIDTWGGLLNTISWQLPALMLSSFFSLSVVGFYALGLTLIMRPLSIISNSLSSVFYQKACTEKNIIGNNGELVENLMDKLMFVGILPTTVLVMVGEELFTIVFGGRWLEAGRYTQILAPWVFFWFISSPLSTLFLAYERQGAALSVNLIIFITRVISLYIGGIYQNIYLALGLFSVTGIAAYAFYAAWNIKLARANRRRILFNFFKYSLHSLPILLFLFLVKYIFHFGSIVILLSALLTVTLYIIIFRNKIISLFGQANLPFLHLSSK